MRIGLNSEELELLRHYEPQNDRSSVLQHLRFALPYVTDKLSADITSDLIDTLGAMTNEQFEQAVTSIL